MSIARKLKIINEKKGMEGVCLVAVSKRQSKEKILEAIASGQKDFGENRLQEIKAKWLELKKQHPEVVLHFIGPIQSNKIKDIVAYCDVIHSVDSISTLASIVRVGAAAQISCFIQVNIGKEDQKSGVLPDSLDELVGYAREHGIPILGLMCIPPNDGNPRSWFKDMHRLNQLYGFPYLSMGMSNDYEVAIQQGATHIRVGTSIFGERE